MRKILIEVSVPAAGKSYDLWVMCDTKLNQLENMVCTAISKLGEGAFVPDEDSTLCSYENGRILEGNMTIAEAGIGNGYRLMLI